MSRAVRLILQFLQDHTAARQAHLVVDAENIASLRVARAVHATADEQWVSDRGRTLVRHVLSLDTVQPRHRGGAGRLGMT